MRKVERPPDICRVCKKQTTYNKNRVCNICHPPAKTRMPSETKDRSVIRSDEEIHEGDYSEESMGPITSDRIGTVDPEEDSLFKREE